MPHSGSTTVSDFVEQNLETEATPEATQTYAYWKSLSSSVSRLPRWRDFDWMEIPLHIISCCGVVDVVEDDREFVYRFWGTRHVSMHDQELTNRSIHEMRPPSVRDTIVNQYRIVRDAGLPRLFTSTYRSRISPWAAQEFSLRLPFSDDGAKVSHIFALSDISDDFEFARKVCEESLD